MEMLLELNPRKTLRGLPRVSTGPLQNSSKDELRTGAAEVADTS